MGVTGYKCTHPIHGGNRRFVCENRKIVPVNFTAKPQVLKNGTILDQSTLGRTISDRRTEFLKSLATVTRITRRVRTRSQNKTVYRLCKQTIFYSSTVCSLTVVRRKFSNYGFKNQILFQYIHKIQSKNYSPHTHMSCIQRIYLRKLRSVNTYMCNTIV